VLVMGLGRFGGGVGVTRWLVEQGAAVTVTDMAAKDSLRESVTAIDDLPVSLHLGGHDLADLDTADLVIVNPAVPKAKSSFFHEIQRRGIPWTTEMNLFCERCPATVIGVTGTYGKSTTCAMLAEVLRASVSAGRAGFTGVRLGGNIGVSLLSELPRIRKSDVVVLEMSNAQLEDLPQIDWRPGVAVVTNLHPHHLDRHGSFAAYVSAKLNIIGSPQQTKIVVHGEMHSESAALFEHLIYSQKRGRHDGVIAVARTGAAFNLRIPGSHNQRNADCVLAVCSALGMDEGIVRDALGDFSGLAHRLEHVRTMNGVDFINDSKSTSPSATVVALESLDQPAVAMVGGQSKDVALDQFAGSIIAHCRAAVCFGESGPEFARAIQSASHIGTSGTLIIKTAPDLEKALAIAQELSCSGGAVLFSPGAPSFDAYENFTSRGEHFRRLVQQLR